MTIKIKKRSLKLIFIIVIIGILLSISGYYIFFNEKDEYIIKVHKEKKDILICANCHVEEQSSVAAKDTISTNACYKCHKEGIEIPISVSVHIYHQGDLSIINTSQSDYIKRHKESPGECDNCHVYTRTNPPDCRRCHVMGDHMDNNRNSDCLSCHESINDLFKHPAIKLQTHNVFGDRSCTMCHSPNKMNLEMANELPVFIDVPSKLCRQCHYQIYKEWSNKNHYSIIECVDCHNPHSPKVNMSDLNITTEKLTKEEKMVQEKKKKDEPLFPTKSYYEEEETYSNNDESENAEQ